MVIPSPALAQEPAAVSQAPSLAPTPDEPLLVEIGGFTNFVNNDYGQWSGASGRVMYRGAKRFTPMVEFATQTRPEGTQATFGFDSYLVVSKNFYVVVGAGGSPSGSAVLWPSRRYNGTGVFVIPAVTGLVASVGVVKLEAAAGRRDWTTSGGVTYYRGRSIWNGSVSFNRDDPGGTPSQSGSFAVQYGERKRYWIGGSVGVGRIAYQTISLTPLDVRFFSYGSGAFYSKWIGPKVGVTVRYDYQHQVDAFQRHGIAANLFFELP